MNATKTILTFILALSLHVAFSQNSRLVASTLSENISLQQASLNPINSIEIYPNPAVEFLIIEIKKSELVDAEFEMHSLIGNVINIVPEEIGLDTYRINVKDLSTGYYFLVVKDEVTRYKKAFKFLKR